MYSVKEAAEKLGLDTSQVRRLLAKGEIKGKKLARGSSGAKLQEETEKEKCQGLEVSMKALMGALLVGLAIYLFFAMIFSIDFSGMSFRDARLVIAVCLGVAVSILSVTKGVQIIYSALSGFVVGAIVYALIMYAFEQL